jgi:hypothetical protein
MALPSTNLGFSNCFSEIGNGTPGAGTNISASILFYDNWTAPNGIKGYGSVQNSGADRIANSQTGTQISLSNYLGLKVLGDNATYQSGNGSYWSQWDNQLTGAQDDFFDLYLYLWDSTKTYVLTSDYQSSLDPSTSTGYTNIGTSIPLVQDAFWQVIFTTNKPSNPFTFEIQCDILNNGTLNSIFSLNQTWANGTTYTFTWDDSGNNSVETANPTNGYAFQMLFY